MYEILTLKIASACIPLDPIHLRKHTARHNKFSSVHIVISMHKHLFTLAKKEIADTIALDRKAASTLVLHCKTMATCTQLYLPDSGGDLLQ